MTKTLSLYDAKTDLSALVKEAAAGEEIVIAKHGKPRARLVALAEVARKPRGFGLGPGRIHFSDPIEPDDAPAAG